MSLRLLNAIMLLSLMVHVSDAGKCGASSTCAYAGVRSDRQFFECKQYDTGIDGCTLNDFTFAYDDNDWLEIRKDCESEDLEGKKCLVVGTKESQTCAATNTGAFGMESGTQQAQQQLTASAAIIAIATSVAMVDL